MNPDKITMICRCEDITLEEIKELIQEGYTTAEEIKRISRCGMGPCQGRTCRELLLGEIAKALGEKVGKVASTKYRPPTKPIRLGGAVKGDVNDLE
ncbi:MAG: (2Fe-2S)-binding protein [Firmicutes bacterium]|nr:(2Fe-2S)-binding protein [Bacillota bacterium]